MDNPQSFCFYSVDTITKPLEDYQLLILPDLRNLSDELASRLDTYVANGGKLLATGMTSTCDLYGNPLNAIRLDLDRSVTVEASPLVELTRHKSTDDRFDGLVS